MSSLPRVRFCGNRPIDATQPTKLRLGPDGVSHFASLQSCSSPWACPTCAGKIAAGRVVEVDTAVRKHQTAGGGAAMLTCTFAHTRSERLADLLAAQQRAWELLRQSRTWRAANVKYGIVMVKRVSIGTIRFREITYGENGWHPHFHLAFLTIRALTEDERRQLEADLSSAWLAALKSVGRSGLSGIALRLDAWKAEELAEYLTKQGTPTLKERAWGMAQEVAGAAFKKGQPHKGLTPWDLLDLASTGDADAFRLWVEYEEATRGKRTCQWSQDLRSHLEVGDEQTDEELAEAEVGGIDVAGLYAAARREVWRASHKGVALLEACERSPQAAWSYLREHAPPGSWIAYAIDQAEEQAS